MATFGNENEEASASDFAGVIRGTRFTCPQAGIANFIKVIGYIAGDVTKIRGHLYDAVGAKVVNGETDELLLDTSTSYLWRQLNFSVPKPSLLAVTDYYIVAWSDKTVYGKRLNNGAVDQAAYDVEVYNGFPANLDFIEDDHLYSIYCDYTPSVGGSGFSSGARIALGLAAWMAIQKREKHRKRSILLERAIRQTMKPVVTYLRKVDRELEKVV